ncbi:MAG TPA: hypothetical protein VF263_12780 [Longimicrobiaceae bacterium]
MKRAATLLAALCVAAAACDSPLRPGEVEGSYVLTSVGGAPLPAVLLDDENFRVHVLASTLRLERGGEGTEWIVQRTLLRASGGPETTRSDVRRLGYRLNDGRVEITYACPPDATCLAGPHARASLTADGLVLRATGYPSEMTFRRVGD